VDTIEAASVTQPPPEISKNPTLNQLEKITNAFVRSPQPLQVDLTDGVDISEESTESMTFKSAEEDLGWRSLSNENVNDDERFLTALEKENSEDEDWTIPSKHRKAESVIARTKVYSFNSNHMWLTCRNHFGNVFYSVLTQENALYT